MSRDGDLKAFHRYCDGIRPTVTIIQADNGTMFGGYTDIPWESEGFGEMQGKTVCEIPAVGVRFSERLDPLAGVCLTENLSISQLGISRC